MLVEDPLTGQALADVAADTEQAYQPPGFIKELVVVPFHGQAASVTGQNAVDVAALRLSRHHVPQQPTDALAFRDGHESLHPAASGGLRQAPAEEPFGIGVEIDHAPLGIEHQDDDLRRFHQTAGETVVQAEKPKGILFARPVHAVLKKLRRKAAVPRN